jgi:hypothetical protein
LAFLGGYGKIEKKFRREIDRDDVNRIAATQDHLQQVNDIIYSDGFTRDVAVTVN